MPHPKNPVPTYRLHKQSGQAVVTLNLNGRRRDFLLGRHGSPESLTEHQRVIADHAASRGGNISTPAPVPPLPDITVNELCARFWGHAEAYYRDSEGNPTSELADLRYAVRVFREGYGSASAREFGPLAL